MQTPIQKARKVAFANLGIPGKGTVQEFSELDADQKKRVNDEMALYIIENPAQFEPGQVASARKIVNRPQFGRDLPEIETLTFAEAFGDEVQNAVSTTSDVVGKGISGGIAGLLGGNIFTLAALGVAGFVAYRVFVKK